jgi:hypothetical protein
MLDTHIVSLAVEYLDACQASGRQTTLVGMHWHIDGRNRTVPSLNEVNEALSLRPQLLVSRQGGNVVFSPTGTERDVTPDDMRRADNQYRSEFSAEFRNLRK